MLISDILPDYQLYLIARLLYDLQVADLSNVNLVNLVKIFMSRNSE